LQDALRLGAFDFEGYLSYSPPFFGFEHLIFPPLNFFSKLFEAFFSLEFSRFTNFKESIFPPPPSYAP